MNNKAMFEAVTVVLSALAIIAILFAAMLFMPKSKEDARIQILAEKEVVRETNRELSLFEQTVDGVPITELLINERTSEFSELVKTVYGRTVQCRLVIDGKELGMGCLEMNTPPGKFIFDAPYSDGELHRIVFEVVQ